MDLTNGVQLNRFSTDGKLAVNSFARPFGTITSFVDEGDDLTSSYTIGNGQKTFIEHQIGQDMSNTIYIDFNVKTNITYIQDVILNFSNANFDKITIDLVSSTTTYTEGTNTNYTLTNNSDFDNMIVPASGNGNINVDLNTAKFVEMPRSIDNYMTTPIPGFWNADYDPDTKLFSNITPAPDGTGIYNLYGTEYSYVRFAGFKCIGTNVLNLFTNTVIEFNHGERIKITYTTNTPDHNWQANVVFKVHRAYTVNFY
jgi:hypothetical protein